MARLEPFDLPTWIGSVSTVPDSTVPGGVAMTCLFQKPDHQMRTTRIGAALWSTADANFTELSNWSMIDGTGGAAQVSAGCCGQAVINSAQISKRSGPPTTTVTMEDSKDFVVYGGQTRGVWPLSSTRVPATVGSIKDVASYENYTPLRPGSTSEVVRDASGAVVWAWRKGAAPMTQTLEAALVKSGALKQSERRTLVYDENGDELALAGGSVPWNEHRQKYVAIIGARPTAPPDSGSGEAAPAPAPSFDGEIYYAEGDTLTSGWSNATLVITHATSGYSCCEFPFWQSLLCDA